MISHHENHIPRASNKLWRMVKVIDCSANKNRHSSGKAFTLYNPENW